MYTEGRREGWGDRRRRQHSSLCRSICEGRSRPKQWGTENKEPAEISARLGLQRTAGGTEGGGTVL